MDELTKNLETLAQISEFLINHDIDKVEGRIKPNSKNWDESKLNKTYLRTLYNKEIIPEVTLLWKALTLSAYPIASLILDSGIASVDNQMLKSGDTCLLKAIKEDVGTDSSACMNNERDREYIIRFLLDQGEEWWADPTVRDADGTDCFEHSTAQAKRLKIKDYMKVFKSMIDDNE